MACRQGPASGGSEASASETRGPVERSGHSSWKGGSGRCQMVEDAGQVSWVDDGRDRPGPTTAARAPQDVYPPDLLQQPRPGDSKGFPRRGRRGLYSCGEARVSWGQLCFAPLTARPAAVPPEVRDAPSGAARHERVQMRLWDVRVCAFNGHDLVADERRGEGRFGRQYSLPRAWVVRLTPGAVVVAMQRTALSPSHPSIGSPIDTPCRGK